METLDSMETLLKNTVVTRQMLRLQVG